MKLDTIIQNVWVATLQDCFCSLCRAWTKNDETWQSERVLSLADSWLATSLTLKVLPPSREFICKDAPATKRELDEFLVTGTCKNSCPTFIPVLDFVTETLFSDQGLTHDERVAAIKFLRQTLGLYSRLTVHFERERVDAFFAEMQERVTEEPLLPKREEVVLLGEIGRAIFAHYSLDAFVSWDPQDPPRYADGPGVVAEHDRSKLIKFLDAQSHSRGDSPLHAWPQWIWRETLLGTELQELFLKIPEHSKAFAMVKAIGNNSATAAKATAVPKDFRGPRGIAEEPCWKQYIQQGIRDSLYRWFPKSPLKRAIHIDDQTFNQEAARIGSLNGSLATIDLKDASDTVRTAHVEALLRRRPDLLSVLLQARTGFIQFRDASKVEISSFATMGSAICFPMESIMYAAICLLAVWRVAEQRLEPKYGLPITPRNVDRVIGWSGLLVYGDDIVVRTELAPLVLDELKLFGMRPNLQKTCLMTPFRESCGKDYWGGSDVSILRPRHLPGSVERTLAGDMDNVQQFLERGLLRTAQVLADETAIRWSVHVNCVVNWKHPAVLSGPNVRYLETDKACEVSRHPDYQGRRLHVKMQCFGRLQLPSVVQAYRRALTPKAPLDWVAERAKKAWAMLSCLPRYASMAAHELGLPDVDLASDPVDTQRPKIILRWVACPLNVYTSGCITPKGAKARVKRGYA